MHNMRALASSWRWHRPGGGASIAPWTIQEHVWYISFNVRLTVLISVAAYTEPPTLLPLPALALDRCTRPWHFHELLKQDRPRVDPDKSALPLRSLGCVRRCGLTL